MPVAVEFVRHHRNGIAAGLLAGVGFCVGAGHVRAADAVPAASQTPAGAPKWSIELNGETRFVSWSGTRGFPTVIVPAGFARGKGFEFTTPLGLQLTGHAPGQWKLEVLLRGNSVRSAQQTPGLQGSHRILADTLLSTTFTYEGFGALQPFVSLALNLPTGDRRLSLRGSNARMDPDIVEVPAFGEGRNFGPTLGANLALTENWLLSVSTGRTIRGRFVQGTTAATGLVTLTHQEPGAESAVNASLTYNAGPFNAAAAVSLAFPDSDRVDRAFSIQQGHRLNVSLDAGYKWNDVQSTKAQLAISRTGRNRVIDNVALAIAVEPFNSNSIRYRGSLEHAISWGAWKFTALSNLTYRDRNQWQPLDQQFVSAKWRVGAGAQLAYDISSAATLSARLERFWVREGLQTEKLIGGVLSNGLAIPTVESRGWTGGLSASLKF
jgi:hypothetical protein